MAQAHHPISKAMNGKRVPSKMNSFAHDLYRVENNVIYAFDLEKLKVESTDASILFRVREISELSYEDKAIYSHSNL